MVIHYIIMSMIIQVLSVMRCFISHWRLIIVAVVYRICIHDVPTISCYVIRRCHCQVGWVELQTTFMRFSLKVHDINSSSQVFCYILSECYIEAVIENE